MPAPLRVLPDLDTLSDTVAKHLAELATQTLQKQNRFSIALAGGKTPRALYDRMATQFGGTLPWAQIHLFWGDERYVSKDDDLSNFRMVKESLLDRITIPTANIHEMPTGFIDPDEAARHYELALRDYFGSGEPKFDLILLGMGADGHTASLFPGAPALQESGKWVVSTRAKAEPPIRLTLTLPVILKASSVYFLIAGSDKAEVLREIWEGEESTGQYPAARVLYSRGPDITCWIDAAAAAYICP